MLRLEALCWPEDPICPRCRQWSDKPWQDARRGRGWRCRNPDCKARFDALQAIPGVGRINIAAAKWFRAVYLLTANSQMTTVALSEALDVERSSAATLRNRIDAVRVEDPLMLERLVAGPSGDAALLRRARKRSR